MLSRYSDGAEVSLSDISKYLVASGLLKPDARTLRNDINQLIEFGIDIVYHRSVQNQYYVASRHFEEPELKLLIDAVQSSRFITPKKSKELIHKLSTFAGPNQNKILCRELYVDSRFKSGNESIYITVDRIQTELAAGTKIAFLHIGQRKSAT